MRVKMLTRAAGPDWKADAGVEIDLPTRNRLPREANRALVNVILAVRDRTRGSRREVA